MKSASNNNRGKVSYNMKEPLQIDAARLLQAMSSFAGRIAQTDDPKRHQQAAQQLQRDLRESKVLVNNH
jgi:hypothetical protein